MKKAMKQSKLITILNGISIFALVLMAILLLVYANANNQLSEDNKARYDLTYNANRFMDGSTYLTEEVRAYAATGDKTHYDNFQNEVNNLKNREAGVAAMQEIGITAEEQGMIDQMSSLSNDLVPLEENAMKNVQEGNLEEALDYVYGEQYNTTILQVNELKEEFLSALETRTSKSIQVLNTRSMIIQIFLFLSLILVIIIQLIIMSVTRRRILKPIIAVRDQMGEISRGNLSAEFPLEPDTSEIGMLVDSIHGTKTVLKQYIHDIDSKLAQMAEGSMDLSIDTDYINQTARLVSDESEQVASDSRVLSDGAVDQASAIEELSASILSLSGQVSSTSQDADTARKISVDSAAQLNTCSKQMDKLTSAMENISESSQQISGIIKTIEDISFQTNILALNASIEAARAGVSGKGFAVVADEVQSLANKSADAAQDITNLIERSIELVKYGTALSDETTKALSVGVSGAQSSADLIQKIADSAQQQALSLEQLTAGVEQISVVIQTNTNTAEKSASSANELYRQAGELKQSVQRFKLR